MMKVLRMLRQHPALAVIGMANIGLALALVLLLTVEPAPFGDSAVMPPMPIEPVTLATRSAFDRQALSEVADRPVFNPSRRRIELPPQPTMAASAPVKPPAPPFPPIEVLGLAQSSRTAVAVLRVMSEGKVVMLREGEALQGWIVSAIDADRVRFERDGEQKEFRMPKPQSLDGIGILGKPGMAKPQ